jgi:KAP family P-loop domain
MPWEKGSGFAIAKDGAKVWLDTPTEEPVFRFDRIAAGLARIIAENDPHFAVGIFGGWGSGKTTLMNAIRDRLNFSSCVVCVDFSAWRFEREPSLLVPLLDTIRGALAKWSKDKAKDGNARKRAWEAARRMAPIVAGLASGLSAEFGLPGAVKVGYDLDKGMNAMKASRKPDRPQSLYFAAFEELAQAVKEFSSDIRVVVFVDDLDRCLSGKALEVLESMKLFFDIPGFIFVAGLDEDVVQEAIGARLFESDRAVSEPSTASTGSSGAAPGPSAGRDRSNGAATRQLGRDYLEKIFQVPYYLPRTTINGLGELLTSMYQRDFPGARSDEPCLKYLELLKSYLQYISVNGRINPRAVKRYLNACTLKMLTYDELEPSTTSQDCSARIILALEVLNFRYEWRPVHEEILVEWMYFKVALNRFLGGDKSAIENLSRGIQLSPQLERYLRSKEFRFIAEDDIDLEPYVSSTNAEGTRPAGQEEVYRRLSKLHSEAGQILGVPLPQVSHRDRLTRAALECFSAVSTYITSSDPFYNDIQEWAAEFEKFSQIKPPHQQSDKEARDEFSASIKDFAEKIHDIEEHILLKLHDIRETLTLEPDIDEMPTPAPDIRETPTPAPDIRETPTPAPVGVSDRDSYATKAMAIVEAALPGGWHLDRQAQVSDDHQFDGLIKSGATNIVVEAFYNPQFTGGKVSRAIREARRSGQTSIDGALVIARSRGAPGFRRLESDLIALELPHKVLQWEPDRQDNQPLTEAVRELIQELGS